MITLKDCSVTNCGSVFGLSGNVELNIDGLYVDNCSTVYDIDSEDSNINAHATNLHIKNTDTYIKVGKNKTDAVTPVNNIKQIQVPIPPLNESQSLMRIAQQYISMTTKSE